MTIDLHTHSAVSDGTDTPAELVASAAAAGLTVVALTDHDTFDGLPEALAAGQLIGIEVVPGMELSCSRHHQSVHLLAYGADPADPALAEEMALVRDGRSGRLRPVLVKLAELGVPVSEEEVLAFVWSSPSVGRPHIADALVAAGHVKDRKEAFDRFLADGGPAHVARYAIDIGRGVDLVHGAGGVAVIAHPWGRGREELLPPSVLTALVAEHGLDGIEVDHQDHDAAARAGLRQLADRLGVLATGSSDYHGTGKVDHDLGVNTTDPETYARLRALLDRRAPATGRSGG
jgi:predicted metal-dependent phosphoesterase TrpH